LTKSFRPHYVPGVDSTSNRNEYQEYFGGGGGNDSRCVGLTTLPLSCADCIEILEAQPPGTLRAWCENLYKIVSDCVDTVRKFLVLKQLVHIVNTVLERAKID